MQHHQHEKPQDLPRAVDAGDDLIMVFQPIVNLVGFDVVGLEALARFPKRLDGPAELFADARRRGVGLDLELRAARTALGHIVEIPERTYLSVNASPATLTSREFLHAVDDASPERIVVEVTEHSVVQDYDRLLVAVKALRDRGVRLAVDDVGMGFSGLHHILTLSPDVIKIDAALVRDIHVSPAKQAMISALITFAARMHIEVVAEGIETAAELQALRVLGVGYGQGYHISLPRQRPDLCPGKAWRVPSTRRG